MHFCCKYAKLLNSSTALPNLHLDAVAMSEIRQALVVGKTVTTHTDLLIVPGYKGAGYVIVDADTGDAVYKISGSKNGGFCPLPDNSCHNTKSLITKDGNIAKPCMLAGLALMLMAMATGTIVVSMLMGPLGATGIVLGLF